MRRFVSVLFGSAILLSLASRAEAQELQLTGPLAGAPAVRHERLYREGKFEIAPTVSFTLLDEYRRTIFTGARLQYNITDWFGFGVWGAYGAVQIDTDLTTEIDANAVRNIETAVNLNHSQPNGTNVTPTGRLVPAPFTNQVATWSWVVAPQVQLTPFRGKLAIFEKAFVDTDAYFHLGVAFNGVKERGNCGDGGGDPACLSPSSFQQTSRMAVAPTLGIGLHFFMVGFMSLGVEYRAVPFAWNRPGFDVAGGGSNGNFPDYKVTSADRTFKWNQMITIEIGFGLPPKLKVSD